MIEILIFIAIAGSAGLIWFFLIKVGNKITKILKLKNLGDGGWNSFIIANILIFGFFAIVYFFVKVLF